MAYVTIGQAVGASVAAWGSKRSAIETQLTKSAASGMDTNFDIFLSHSYEDATVIAGVKALIERERLSVYVDWIEDAQADRKQVTPATASMLRGRMQHCRFLLFASSKASPTSKWMPWELGYFDGLKPGRVGILPIVITAGAPFDGQEYLGLYPSYQYLKFKDGEHLGRQTGHLGGESLRQAAGRS